MRLDKASGTVKVLSATLGDFSCLSLPSSSSSSSSEHEVMLTVTFAKKAIGKSSSSVLGTNSSYSSRPIGRIPCLLIFLDFFPSEWRGLFFLPCLFLRRRGSDQTWFCFLSLRWVTRVHPSSSSSVLSDTSPKRSASIKGPWDSIRTTTGSKLSNWIVINFSP